MNYSNLEERIVKMKRKEVLTFSMETGIIKEEMRCNKYNTALSIKKTLTKADKLA